MKPVEIVLRKGGGRRRRKREGVNLMYIESTFVNITMYVPIQLLYTNKIKNHFKKRRSSESNYKGLGFKQVDFPLQAT
jgi:hypothetical protein